MTVIKAADVKIETGGSNNALGPYRAELFSDSAGLTQFGAFVEELPPGSRSSFAHWHAREDEMVLILSGRVTLSENGVDTELYAGDAACWRAGDAVAHSLHNHSDAPARYVVIGTRAPNDRVTYPGHDRVLHYDRTTDTRAYETLDGRAADKPT